MKIYVIMLYNQATEYAERHMLPTNTDTGGLVVRGTNILLQTTGIIIHDILQIAQTNGRHQLLQ